MKGRTLSAPLIISLVEQNRRANAEQSGHMACPICKGTLYYFFENNGPVGNVLHVSCSMDDCLPLSALRIEGKK